MQLLIQPLLIITMQCSSTWANYGGKDVIVALTKEGNDEKPGTQNVGGSSDEQTIAFSGQFNYQNTFKKCHNVSAMLIANGYQQTISAQYHRISNANWHCS